MFRVINTINNFLINRLDVACWSIEGVNGYKDETVFDIAISIFIIMIASVGLLLINIVYITLLFATPYVLVYIFIESFILSLILYICYGIIQLSIIIAYLIKWGK